LFTDGIESCSYLVDNARFLPQAPLGITIAVLGQKGNSTMFFDRASPGGTLEMKKPLFPGDVIVVPQSFF